MDYHGPGSFLNRCYFHISGVTPAKKHCKLIFVYNDLFCSRSEIKVGIIYSVLQYIGHAADAASYTPPFSDELPGSSIDCVVLQRLQYAGSHCILIRSPLVPRKLHTWDIYCQHVDSEYGLTDWLRFRCIHAPLT